MQLSEKFYVKSKYCDLVIESDWLGDLTKQKIVSPGLEEFFHSKHKTHRGSTHGWN